LLLPGIFGKVKVGREGEKNRFAQANESGRERGCMKRFWEKGEGRSKEKLVGNNNLGGEEGGPKGRLLLKEPRGEGKVQVGENSAAKTGGGKISNLKSGWTSKKIRPEVG